MSELKLAGLRVHLNQTSVSNGSSMKAAVVLLHGFGAPGNDLVSLGDVLAVPEGTGIFFPEGPLELETILGPHYGGARAWWPIDMAELQSAMLQGQVARAAEGLADGLEQARNRIISLLDELQAKFGLDSSKIVIGGFSQGAVACLDVALRDSRKFAGLLLMSGTMVSRDSVAELAPRSKCLPALISHGVTDPVLPYSIAESLRDQLKIAGWKVSWVSFFGGHGIPPEVIRAASALLPEWLS